MANLSRALSAGLLHPRENLWKTDPLGSINAETITDCDGASTVSLDLRGTFNMTVEISGTVDGTNWTPIAVRPINQTAVGYVASIVGTTAGMWVGTCAMYRKVRARVTAYTSGSATAFICADNSTPDRLTQGLFATSLQTQTAAAAAICTLTLAAPGAGLRHYITSIVIQHFTTLLLTAAAAPVIVTTTNITGAPAFNFRADAAAMGSLTEIARIFDFPLATTAQNTATTIVAPATTSVLWRVTAGFFVAP